MIGDAVIGLCLVTGAIVWLLIAAGVALFVTATVGDFRTLLARRRAEQQVVAQAEEHLRTEAEQ